MKKFRKLIAITLCAFMCATILPACSKEKEQIVIYTCANDDRIAHMTQALENEFPEYEFLVEYQSTSKLAAKLLAEGTNTDCDIIHDLSYLNLDSLNNKGLLADLSAYDSSAFLDELLLSENYMPEVRTGGAIIINTTVLDAKGLEKPQSYEDLLKPEYKGLISMPDPKSSGTGYMFVKSLVNAWGEDRAFDYFTKLSENILQFTSSGNGPVNALVQQEVAIGLGMTSNAVVQINEGVPLEILFFEEGSPHSMYGQAIIEGKDSRESVQEVFEFLLNVYNYETCKLYAPEQIYKDTVFETENYPVDIIYSDMSNDTLSEKERLLEMWNI